MSEYDAQAAVEELQSAEKFDLKAALKKKTSPVDDVKVYLDGGTMHGINLLLDEIVSDEADIANLKNTQAQELAPKLSSKADLQAADADGITEDPGVAVIEAEIVKLRRAHAKALKEGEKEIEAKRNEVELLIGVVRDSALTFRLRGLIRKQAELIDASHRRKIKEPARGDFESDTDFEHEYTEKLIKRNIAINSEMVRKSIIAVAGPDGNFISSVYDEAEIDELRDNLDKSEWDKLENLAANLTFAKTLFNHVVAEDADFLPKP